MSTVVEAPGHPVLAAISTARAALVESADEALWTLSERQVAGAVSAALSLVAQAQAVLLTLVGEADAREVPASIGSPSTVSWLRDRHKLHPGEAAQLVRTAAAFRDGTLPATKAALAAGDISLPNAHVIRRACADLPDDLDPAEAARVEAGMVQNAKDFDPVIAGRLARHAISVIDPDGEDERDGKRLVRAEKRAAANNVLSLSPDGDGGIYLRGRLDADGHSIVDSALQALMQPRATTPDGPDLRTTDRRRAEALVELCRRMLAAGDLPSHGGSKPQVVVTMPLKTLTRQVGVGLLPTGEPSARRRRGTGRATPGSSPRSWTRTADPWTSPMRNASSTGGSAAPWRSATEAAPTPAATAPSPGAKDTTSSPGHSAGRRPSRTACSSAGITTATSSTATGKSGSTPTASPSGAHHHGSTPHRTSPATTATAPTCLWSRRVLDGF